jgi:hypothetical protein
MLRKNGWTPFGEEEKKWVRKGDYYILLEEEEWILFVKLGRDLIQVQAKVYGRRQSQDIQRAMDKDQRVRQRCTSFSSKVVR